MLSAIAFEGDAGYLNLVDTREHGRGPSSHRLRTLFQGIEPRPIFRLLERSRHPTNHVLDPHLRFHGHKAPLQLRRPDNCFPFQEVM